jgi:hypothetical protein
MAPLSYQIIENETRTCLARMEHLVDEYATAVDEQAEAEVAYKVGIAKARLDYRYERSGQKVTDQMADDNAVVATEDLRREHLVTTARLEAVKQASYTARDRLAALRSLMASYREAGG